MVAAATGGLIARPHNPAQAPMIGPNAILQMLPVLDAAGVRGSVLARAGITQLPSGDEMIPQAPAARLHQALRAEVPEAAPELAREAGRLTGLYILENRIPAPAQKFLKALPAPLAAGLLAKAIGKHAWTFAGSGRFAVQDRWHFALADNPIVAGEHSASPLCHWHAAVFEQLYKTLVHPEVTCRETACCATGDSACRFTLSRPSPA